MKIKTLFSLPRQVQSAASRVQVFLLLFLGQNFGQIYAIDLKKIYLKADIPLGLTYDGRVAWLVDAKNRTLEGYDIDEKRKIRTRRLRVPGIRDIAFWENKIVSPYKSYIYCIDPINGNLIERIPAPFLSNPVSIAMHNNLAYIYDKKEKKFFRYDLKKKILFGYFKYNEGPLRGIDFYRGFIWAVNKEASAIKFDPLTGTQQGTIPIPENSYGISFIEDALFCSFT